MDHDAFQGIAVEDGEGTQWFRRGLWTGKNRFASGEEIVYPGIGTGNI